MARYNVFIEPTAVRELEAIPLKEERQRLAEQIRALADEPRPPGCEKLHAQERYRLRQGRYRIVYSIDEDEQGVLVVKIGQR